MKMYFRRVWLVLCAMPDPGHRKAATRVALLPLLLMIGNIHGVHAVTGLELAEAQAIALAENPGIAEMQARYEALLEVAPQRASLPDPVLNLGAMNFPWDDWDRNQEPMTQLQVGVSQVFPFPGKLDIREDIAFLEAEAASHSVDEARLTLSKNVAISWWEQYYLERASVTVQQNLTLLRQLVDIATAKYQVGQGLQQDVLLAQLELSKGLDNQIQIEAMREQARIRLNLLMGRAPGTNTQVASAAPGGPQALRSEAALFEMAANARPALAGHQANIAASESRLQLAKRDYYPDFKVGLTYGNRDENDLGYSRQDFLSVMVSINLPLYAGSKQDKAVQQRSRELAKTRYALIDSMNHIRSTIAESANDYRRATMQRALFDSGVIPQARQTVASMKAGYQVGQVDFLNLVRSQVTLFNYELRYWKSVSEANQAVARLEAAVGQEDIYE